jgi:hypothetical protein
MHITSLVPWSQALLTPVVATVGVYVAWQQWRTNYQKLRYDLFEKRYSIYKAAGDFISSIMNQGKPSQEAQNAFLSGTQGSRLLFGKEVSEYLYSILWVDAVNMETNQFILTDLPVGEERTKYVNEIAKIKKKMPVHYEKLDQIFAPYINMSQVK